MTKYYTKVLGTVMEIVPVSYSPTMFKEQGGSVFCRSVEGTDAGLLIRLTPDLISTRRKGFKPNNKSRQRLGRHFAATLPLPERLPEKIAEVPSMQQLEKLLRQ